MKIAHEFLQALQNYSEREKLLTGLIEGLYQSEALTFEIILEEYAKMLSEVSDQDQKRLSSLFWQLIKFYGTPIIENDSQDESKCHVYFLFPKEKLTTSSEQPHTKKDLYLQGDFHSYGATDSRARVNELFESGIMWRKDTMPRGAIIVYKYIEVEPSQRGRKPIPELAPFFKDEPGFIPATTNSTFFPIIPQNNCSDIYSRHTSPYPGFANAEKIFRVSAESMRAHIALQPIHWPHLLGTKLSNQPSHFSFYATLYSDQAGDLKRCDAQITEQYHDELNFSEITNNVYANFTRDIQVFSPASKQIDDIIVINDGIPYLITGMLEYFERMVDANIISPNIALVFVHPLPGLKNTLSQKEAQDYANDPSSILPGMGVRLIDYKHGIDQYVDFLSQKLLPQLKSKYGLDVPSDAEHRIMIGSSLSGTASIYIASVPNLFGAVIAQSPSADNRGILNKRTKELQTTTNIYLSCGEFEHPDYAAANDNVDYAAELAQRLQIPLHKGAYGHQFIAWNEELPIALPIVLNTLQDTLQATKKNHSALSSQSLFSQSTSTQHDDEAIKIHEVKRKKGG